MIPTSANPAFVLAAYAKAHGLPVNPEGMAAQARIAAGDLTTGEVSDVDAFNINLWLHLFRRGVPVFGFRLVGLRWQAQVVGGGWREVAHLLDDGEGADAAERVIEDCTALYYSGGALCPA